MYYSPNNNLNSLMVVLQTLIKVVIILKLLKAFLKKKKGTMCLCMVKKIKYSSGETPRVLPASCTLPVSEDSTCGPGSAFCPRLSASFELTHLHQRL